MIKDNPNFVEYMEELHLNLKKDRHEGVDLTSIYETCIQDISEQTGVDLGSVHRYYVERYNYNYRKGLAIKRVSLDSILETTLHSEPQRDVHLFSTDKRALQEAINIHGYIAKPSKYHGIHVTSDIQGRRREGSHNFNLDWIKLVYDVR